MDNLDEQFEPIRRMVTRAYNTIARILGGLTPPIVIPRLGEDAESHLRSMDAIDRAREIIGDLPINQDYVRLVRHSIIEWATLYEMVAIIEEAGATPLRIAAASMAARRLQICFKHISKLEP